MRLEKNQKAIIFLLIFVCLLGGMLGFSISRQVADQGGAALVASQPEKNTDEQRVAELERRLDALSREISSNRSQNAGRVHRPTKLVAGPAGEMIPEQMRLHQYEDEQAMLALANRFNATARDPKWADAAETNIQVALSDPAMKVLNENGDLRDLDCRKNICRIEARFLDRSAASDWPAALLMGLSGSLPASRMRIVQLPYGGVELQMYLVPKEAENLLTTR